MKKIVFITLNILALFSIFQIEIYIFKCHFFENKFSEIKKIILNFSYGFNTSSIFYLLVVYFPDKKKYLASKKTIQKKVNIIHDQLEISIHYLYSKYVDKNKYKNILKLDEIAFENVTTLKTTPMNFEYSFKYKNQDWQKVIIQDWPEINHIDRERQLVNRYIEEIFMNPVVSNQKTELIEALTNLRDSFFYHVASDLVINPMIEGINFNKHVFKYYQNFLVIKKYYEKEKEFKIN